MNNDTKYWVWLSQALGYGSKSVKAVMNFYSSAEEFYNMGSDEWAKSGCFTRKELNSLEKHKLSEAEILIEKASSLGENIITLTDADYPPLLREIFNPPAVIYTKGDISLLESCLCIGIVGTRSATDDGIRTGGRFAKGLALAGAAVISGGALGIDSSAHRGALKAGGITACVLGCGINYNYLVSNARLRSEISEKGVIISEYPPDTPAAGWNFPVRNRIIAGLSKGVLIVEAGEKSGALITAKLALEENRDVFAIPGSVNSTVSVGTNNLIKDGAIPVTSYRDILEEYSDIFTPKITPAEEPLSPEESLKLHEDSMGIDRIRNFFGKKDKKIKTNNKFLPAGLSQNAVTVYNAMKPTSMNVDEIIINSKLETKNALAALTELEFSNLIEALPGARYKIL